MFISSTCRPPKAAQRLALMISSPRASSTGEPSMNSLKDALVQELLQLATPELHRRHFDESGDESIPYKETLSGLIHFKQTQTGTEIIELTNFIAHIINDTEEDDGSDTRRVLTIEAQVGDIVRAFDVTIPRFQSMQWPLEFLGAHAIVYPGRESH